MYPNASSSFFCSLFLASTFPKRLPDNSLKLFSRASLSLRTSANSFTKSLFVDILSSILLNSFTSLEYLSLSSFNSY